MENTEQFQSNSTLFKIQYTQIMLEDARTRPPGLLRSKLIIEYFQELIHLNAPSK